MAPEQFRGQALPATDLYSLGATLLYLLTHKSPADLPQNKFKLDFRNSVDISQSFADWLNKILEPSLEDRFSNADAAFAELVIDRSKPIASKKKQPKLIAGLGIGVLTLGLVTSVVYYKWFFLSRLGFYPDGMCSADAIAIKKYLSEGGKANVVLNERIKERKLILNCIINSSNIELDEKQKLADLLIRKGLDVNQKDKHDTTSLLLAAKQEYKELLQLLLENGADPNIKNDSQEIPLLVTHDEETVKLLVEHGVDVNTQFEEENIPSDLYVAFTAGDPGLLEFLIERGLDINTQGFGGYVLFYAIDSGEIEKVKYLVERGADVNVRDNKGETPLLKGVLYGDRELVQYLIDRGADPRYLDYQFIKDNYNFDAAQLKKVKYFLDTNQFKVSNNRQ